MKFKISALILILSMLAQAQSWASAVRTVDADALTTSNHANTLTLPAVTDTLTANGASQALTNKTINGSNNTLSNIPVAAEIAQEVPSGTVNGSNVTFTLANTPGSSGSVQIYRDGLILTQGGGNDYTITGATITMTTAPSLGQSLLAVYPKH